MGTVTLGFGVGMPFHDDPVPGGIEGAVPGPTGVGLKWYFVLVYAGVEYDDIEDELLDADIGLGEDPPYVGIIFEDELLDTGIELEDQLLDEVLFHAAGIVEFEEP